MRKASLSVCMACLAGLAAVPAGAANTSTTFTVSATVVATCSVSASNLAFGSYTGTGNTDQTTTVTVTCGNGTGYSVALNDGANASGSTRRMANGSNYLAYELYSDSGRTTVWNAAAPVAGTGNGGAQTLTVYGRIPTGQSVPAGAYTDTVQVTVTY